MTITVPAPPPAPADAPAPGWEVDALCAQTDPELWFPEIGQSSRAAKQICATCPVRANCLDYALARTHLTGIWGGLSERERWMLRRRE
ncbi:WhiB family transcriptional regulator [Streptomyces sp. NPDC002564]|uniref:WhiB family transcriptional regulator n=1 Tax=Streptomyces sp. NPDC002564 TaxID=3364649 RepID=UPI0036B9F2BA